MPSDSAGLNLGGTDDTPGVADTGGAGTGGFANWSKSKKTAAGIGGFLVLAVGTYFLAKRKSSSSSSSSSSGVTTVPEVVTGSSAGSGDAGNDGSLLAGILALSGTSTSLANTLSQVKDQSDTTTTTYNYGSSGGFPSSLADNPGGPEKVAVPATSEPGYASGAGELFTNNPSLSNGSTVPGITGYTGSFNGVPL